MLFALLGLHALLAAVAPLVARRAGRTVFYVCALAPAATVGYAAARAPAVLAGGAVSERFAWVDAVGLTAAVRLDGFALLMVALVSGIGTLIFGYSASYFRPHPGKPAASGPDLGRFAAHLTAFAGAMLGLVLADNLLLLYVFWELTSITSYLLIGFEDTKGSARAAALQAILVTVAGGLAMLAGFVVLGQAAGTYALSGLLADPPTGPAAAAGILLVLAGAFTKSAQAPFHMWLPAAMAAPTPVSAYLHSATMVKAGVYLIARFAPAFAVLPVWRPVVVGVGVATMLLGGYRALRQHDLKLLLAYGTVSQLGFMVALLGAGTPEATLAGTVLLVAHGAFKATLFLVTGIVEHETGSRDLRRLSGLGARLPGTMAVAALAAASMAGVPPLLGFLSKELAYEAFLHAGIGPLGPAALAGIVAASILTFAYSVRFVRGAFAHQPDHANGGYLGPEAHRPSPAFLAPAALLAAAGVVLGLLPGLLSPLTAAAGVALEPRLEPEGLKLWHGLGPALGLSVLTLAAGAALSLLHRPVESFQERVGRRLAPLPSSYQGYRGSVALLNRVSDRVTATVQNGSLPVYLAVIMLTAVALPTSALLAGAPPRLPAVVAESPLQLVVGAGMIVAALWLVRIARRFTVVLLLGAVGYGVAILFVIQGAPDLALTQLLIETLSLVLFVLVMRHLPDRFSPPRWPWGQTMRCTVAGTVGMFVFAFALLAGAARTRPSISGAFLELAVPEAGGRNIVNVILVDFRGYDTLGEITVLCVAAVGIAGLVRASLRRPDASRPGVGSDVGEPDA